MCNVIEDVRRKTLYYHFGKFGVFAIDVAEI